MSLRTLLTALAALAASSASAQQPAAPNPAPPAAAAERTDDEPMGRSRPSEEVVVTGARPLPVPGGEGVITLEQRRRHRVESQCIVQAQGATDFNRPELDSPEDVCRGR